MIDESNLDVSTVSTLSNLNGNDIFFGMEGINSSGTLINFKVVVVYHHITKFSSDGVTPESKELNDDIFGQRINIAKYFKSNPNMLINNFLIELKEYLANKIYPQTEYEFKCLPYVDKNFKKFPVDKKIPSLFDTNFKESQMSHLYDKKYIYLFSEFSSKRKINNEYNLNQIDSSQILNSSVYFDINKLNETDVNNSSNYDQHFPNFNVDKNNQINFNKSVVIDENTNINNINQSVIEKIENFQEQNWKFNYSEKIRQLNYFTKIFPENLNLNANYDLNNLSLENQSNICYLNSILQIILCIKSFEILIRQNPQYQTKPILSSLIGLFENANNKNLLTTKFHKEFVDSVLGKIKFYDGRQQDCHEFFTELLKVIDEELAINNNIETLKEIEKLKSQLFSDPNELKDIKIEDLFYLEKCIQSSSLTSNLFGIYFKTDYKCLKCESSYSMIDYENTLMLHIKNIFYFIDVIIVSNNFSISNELIRLKFASSKDVKLEELSEKLANKNFIFVSYNYKGEGKIKFLNKGDNVRVLTRTSFSLEENFNIANSIFAYEVDFIKNPKKENLYDRLYNLKISTNNYESDESINLFIKFYYTQKENEDKYCLNKFLKISREATKEDLIKVIEGQFEENHDINIQVHLISKSVNESQCIYCNQIECKIGQYCKGFTDNNKIKISDLTKKIENNHNVSLDNTYYYINLDERQNISNQDLEFEVEITKIKKGFFKIFNTFNIERNEIHSNISINDCINFYLKKIKINTKCDFCDSSNKEKHMTFYELPPFLIIHLSRTQINSKNKKKVNFQETLKIQEVNYDLISVVNHIGEGINSGHYLNYSKRKNDEWYLLNDKSITKVDFKLRSDDEDVVYLVYKMIK